MDKMIPLLEKFADKLGTTAEYLWGVLVRQQIVSSIVGLSVFVVCVVAIVLIVKFWDKIYEADWDMAAVAVAIFVSIIGFFCLVYGVQRIINPEYFAFKAILDAIGG